MSPLDFTPLYGLRLTTPRLELRLGSPDELVELGKLAERGIHSPEEMPFAVAWTDGIGKPGFLDDFLAYHRDTLDSWRPSGWTLNLLVWEGPTLVGTQGLIGERLARDKTVETGSWLGARFQRRGIGTEMRAAVLELAFRGLDAELAESSWLDGNEASQRVSAKLGYREAGTSTMRPRGTPVIQHRVRIARRDWSCPISVEISGLEPCLHLFSESL